jgi:regulator of protease activity HflC (stomatin/prohibitin superfamily)
MIALLLAMFALGAGLAAASLRRVPEDTVCTVHRFGRYVRTLTPGLRFTLPFVDRIAHRVRLVGHQVDLPPQALGARTCAEGAVYYQILEPERAGQVLDDVDALVAREACAHLAALAGDATAQPELADLSSQLKSDLNRRLGSLGLRVTRCRMQLSAAA